MRRTGEIFDKKRGSNTLSLFLFRPNKNPFSDFHFYFFLNGGKQIFIVKTGCLVENDFAPNVFEDLLNHAYEINYPNVRGKRFYRDDNFWRVVLDHAGG